MSITKRKVSSGVNRRIRKETKRLGLTENRVHLNDCSERLLLLMADHFGRKLDRRLAEKENFLSD